MKKIAKGYYKSDHKGYTISVWKFNHIDGGSYWQWYVSEPHPDFKDGLILIENEYTGSKKQSLSDAIYFIDNQI